MFEFLLMASLSAPPEPSPYATESLHAFVALANDRIVDGVSYTNRDGVLSAGALYANPSGFFASTELLAFEGDGEILPAEHLLSLESAAGWRFETDGNVFSAALLDYRHAGHAGHAGARFPDHQGAALGFRRGSFGIEIAVEPDRPYFYRRYDTFYTDDVRRTVISWDQPVTADFQWSVGAGRVTSGQSQEHRDFVTGGLLWKWRQLEWQIAVVHASGELDTPGNDDATRLQLRIARPFRIR